MIKKKVLVVASYPIKNPQHGGQKRVQAIVDYYKTIFDEVIFVGVFHRVTYSETDYDKTDLLVAQPDIIKQIEKNPYAVDIIAGEAIANDVHVRSPMAKLLMDFKPDIIQIEQAYPYLGMSSLLRDINMGPLMIYSSHNIEYRMKKGLYKTVGAPAKVSDELVGRIRSLESEFSKSADLVLAVSEDDVRTHREMGAKKCIVIPNGIEKGNPTKAAVNYWREFKKTHGAKTAATFVASAHPPNWQGFLKMLGEDMEFMPDGANIMMAGGVSEYFKGNHIFEAASRAKFLKKVELLGKLPEDSLQGLLHESDIILLPITSGGGSNLKTAEAILSGKKVVATDFAFRGFGKYEALPNIHVAGTKDKFRKAFVEAINAPYVKRTPDQIKLAEHVQWKYCLQPLEKVLPNLKKKVSHRLIAYSRKTLKRYIPTKVKSKIQKVIPKY